MRRGIVNGYEASVRGLAFHIAGHELHHLRTLREEYLPKLSRSHRPDRRRSRETTRSRGTQRSRSARTGSILDARQAGKKHAASAVTAITTKAHPNTIGSRGLTL